MMEKIQVLQQQTMEGESMMSNETQRKMDDFIEGKEVQNKKVQATGLLLILETFNYQKVI